MRHGIIVLSLFYPFAFLVKYPVPRTPLPFPQKRHEKTFAAGTVRKKTVNR